MHQLWMRRILIAVFVVALGHGAVAAGPRHVAALRHRHPTITNPVASEGLRVIAPGTPEFMPEVRKLLDPLARQKAAPFLPKSVVIVNDTGKYVWGFTVIFTFPNKLSDSGNPWRHMISASPGGAATREAMLPPGGRYLVTPIPDFQASTDANGNVRLRPNLDTAMDNNIRLLVAQRIGPQEQVQVSVDSVIFEDGTLTGPDTADRQRKINDQIRAETDLVNLLSDSKGEQLRGKLADLANTEPHDTYSHRMAGVASLLQMRLDKQGEESVAHVLNSIKTTKWFPDGGVKRK